MILTIKKAKHQGSVLLLALFVMGAMMIVSLGTASLTINQIKQTRDIKKATIAFYAAEAGIEEGLYQVRKNDREVEALPAILGGMTDNATSTIAGFDYETIIYDHLNVNEIVSLDLYDISNPQAGIKCLNLQWDGKPASWLEVTWQSFKIGTYPGDANIQKHFFAYNVPGGGTQSYNLNLQGSLPTEDYMHSAQIKALYDEVKNLRVQAYQTYGDPNCSGLVNVPSRLYITSIGEYPASGGPTERAKQKITVSLPEKTPLSPLFDYVMFSEEEIEKTIMYTGSVRGQLVYQECGPFVWYPDCKHTFTGPSWPDTDTITVQNIGIEATTINSTRIQNENPSGVYSIIQDNCLNQTLEYNETCTIEIGANQRRGATADLSVATSSSVLMLLNQ